MTGAGHPPRPPGAAAVPAPTSALPDGAGQPPPPAAAPHGAAGQATVELVALLPLLVVAGLAAAQVLAAGAAREAAAQAAAAGAAALLQRGDPEAEAREAAGVRAGRLLVRVEGRQVEVRVRPRALLPALGEHLEARALADAGPPAGDGPR